jgi:hypothetical protein
MAEGEVMSIESQIHPGHDPRVTLATKKYFSMRPKPLERWLWQQGLPQAVERVFWFHWELGQKNQTWCSQVPIKTVARECCVDPSTVTRAYQVLKALKLIRRQDPPRDPNDPFRQLVALTEVLVPRDLVQNLGREPNRPNRSAQPADQTTAHHATVLPEPTRRHDLAAVGRPAKPFLAAKPPSAASAPIPVSAPRITRTESTAIMAKLSETERARLYQASQRQIPHFEFDANSSLNQREREHVLNTLAATLRAVPTPTPIPARAQTCPKPARLALLEQVRVRRELQQVVPKSQGPSCIANLMRQILWSVEEGNLARFAPSHAVNIALKKIREGSWQTPHRMPPNWGEHRAAPETCRDA